MKLTAITSYQGKANYKLAVAPNSGLDFELACRDNNIAIHVFGLAEENGIMRAICGEEIGTIVK